MTVIAHVATNEAPFTLRPRHSISAILPGGDLPDRLAALDDAVSGPGTVHLLHGELGARILDARGRHHGLRVRLVRLCQAMSAEGNELSILDAALRHGRTCVRIPAVDYAQALRIGRVLVDFGADRVLYYGKSSSQLFN